MQIFVQKSKEFNVRFEVKIKIAWSWLKRMYAHILSRHNLFAKIPDDKE